MTKKPSPLKNFKIKGNGFILRPLEKSDAVSLTQNGNEKLIRQGVGATYPYPYTLKSARWFISHIKKENKKTKYPTLLAIIVDGEVAGHTGLHIKAPHKAEIGYWLGKNYRGKGIMTKVVKTMLNYGFDRFGFRKIYARVFSWNKASIRVLQRNGFKKEGFLRKEAQFDGKFFDEYLFAKFR